MYGINNNGNGDSINKGDNILVKKPIQKKKLE